MKIHRKLTSGYFLFDKATLKTCSFFPSLVAPDLRLHLLDASHSPVLVQTLYGLLMLLPQSEAFHVLRRRLDCLPGNKGLPHPISTSSPNKPSNPRLADTVIPFGDLLAVFVDVQNRRLKYARDSKAAAMLDRLKLGNSHRDAESSHQT